MKRVTLLVLAPLIAGIAWYIHRGGYQLQDAAENPFRELRLSTEAAFDELGKKIDRYRELQQCREEEKKQQKVDSDCW
jgi:hypothetical protein